MKINEVNTTQYQVCEPGFVNDVIRPRLEWALNDNFKTQAIEKLTGATSFLRSYLNDTCNGTVTSDTGKKLIKATFQTGANTIVLASTLFGATAGLLLSGPAAAIGISSLGLAVAVGVVPKAAEKITDKFIDISKNLLSDLKEYFNNRLPFKNH